MTSPEVNKVLQLEEELRQLKAKLGMTSPKSDDMKAPDGAAVVTIMPNVAPVSYTTVRVRRRSDSAEAVIAEHHFDESKHERLDPAPRRRRRLLDGEEEQQEKPKNKVETTLKTRAQLSVQTIATLKLEPEITTSGLSEDDIPDKKSDLVNLIMAIREKAMAASQE